MAKSVNTFYGTAIFAPKLVEELQIGKAQIAGLTLADLSGSTVTGSSNYEFDNPGEALKSTQQIPIDWARFENHTFFNSAESKVNVAFDTLINYFPFDGTKEEYSNFFDDMAGYTKYVYDQFPKSIGFLRFSGSAVGEDPSNGYTAGNGSWIQVQDAAGSLYPWLSRDASGDSVLDPGYRTISFEFWFNSEKQSNDNQIIFQKLSGSEQGITLALSNSADDTTADMLFMVTSGSAILSASTSFPKGGFHHVAAVFDRNPDVLANLKIYLSGALIATSSATYDFGLIDFTASSFMIGTGSIHAAALSYVTPFTPKVTLSGAIDDFRIYHGPRDHAQIIAASSQSAYAEDGLKLYFKFNEATGSYQGNNTVLDFSGNSLHSKVSNFNYVLRDTGSLAPPVVIETLYNNPVLFPGVKAVVDLNIDLLASGSVYDANNPNLITKLIPNHYLQEASYAEGFESEAAETGDQYGFSQDFPGGGLIGSPQIIASMLFTWGKFFDEIKLFIDHFGTLLKIDYDDQDTLSNWMLPFFASYYGFDLPNNFSMASSGQYLSGENLNTEAGVSAKNLRDIQSEIWRRILVNLNYIIKSKGTINGIKAMLRAAGIAPDNIFRFKEYGGSRTITTEDSRVNRSEVSTMLALTSSVSQVKSPFLSGSRAAPGYPFINGLQTFFLNQNFDSYAAKSKLTAHWRFRADAGENIAYAASNLLYADAPTISPSNSPFNGTVIDASGSATTEFGNMYGASFNGSSNYVSGSSSANFVFAKDYYDKSFSIGGWMKATSGGASERVVAAVGSAYSTGNVAWRLVITTSDNLRLYLYHNNNVGVSYNSLADITSYLDGSWHHIMVTYNGDGTAAGIQFYADGAALSMTAAGTSGRMITDEKPLLMGANLNVSEVAAGFFDGSLSEWGLWQNEMLSGSEVSSISSAAPAGNFSSTVLGLPISQISTANEGLFTTSSWSYESFYQFKELSHYFPLTQSLARMFVTGSSAVSSKGALLMNLVAFGTGALPSATGSLTLYARPNQSSTAPLMRLVLTGVNVFDADKWHVSFGRDMGSATGSFATASYFLRAGKQNYGTITEYFATSSMFDEGDLGDSAFSNLSSAQNVSGAFIMLGSGTQGPTSGARFLNSAVRVTDEHARVQNFNGYISQMKFWTKALSETEDKEHIKNFKSVGVEDPALHYNFVTTQSGSFERLRINASTDQTLTKSDASGNLNIFDFSQNELHFTGSGFSAEREVIRPVQFNYSILNAKFDERNADNKIRIRGFEQDVNIDEFNALKSPVTAISLGEAITDDTRFSMEVSQVGALNDDIMNILATLDFYDNAIGDPELMFADSYPALANLREVYFQRLTGRINYKNLFEFYKWFDDSLSIMVERLIPRHTKFLGINFVVESHTLERAKMRYLQGDIYLGENDRRGLGSDLFLQQIVGTLKRY